MPLNDRLTRQFHAFHHAILDDCERASRPGQSDAMALLLRTNAMALAKLELAILARLQGTHDRQQDMDPTAGPADEPASWPDEPAPHPDTDEDHILAGDALSRFVSRRLGPDESPHEVWQRLQDGTTAKPQRNPALPRSGFRSSAG